MTRDLRGFIAGCLVGLLSMQARAALTQALLQQHLGAFLIAFISNQFRQGALPQEMTIADLMAAGPSYRAGGALGTLAERTEALQTFYRQIAARSGENPTGTAPQVHRYKAHYLGVYISTTEVAAIEP